jgi:UDP-4-amino-4,6-dideoxy-N-acetyl-beta-L-altrosamine transaminase
MIYIPYSRQWIDEEDIEEVVKVLRGDFITQGSKVQEFESRLAEYCGVNHAVVFNSGTSALHGAYFSLGLKSGDEFITTPNTFVATSNAGLYLGARPVFVDIEKDTGNMDPSNIEAAITGKTRLIVPIHYAGHPVDMEKIHQIARKCRLSIVEDACHALGARYNGGKIGCCRYSDMAVFSFHPVKQITTGEGGAVLTNDSGYYERLQMFRTHGITRRDFIHAPDGEWYYEMHLLGYNYRMTDFQCALGISQLRKLDRFIQERRRIVSMYESAFDGNAYFDLPVERPYAYCAYHLYPIRLKDACRGKKKELFHALRERGYGVQVHYIPVHMQPYYQNLFGYKRGDFPVVEDYYARTLSLPVYPGLAGAKQDSIIQDILDYFRQG